MTALRSVVTLAAAAALAAGCTLADRRDDPRLLPEGPLAASLDLRIEVRFGTANPKALIIVDGRDRGTFPTNRPIAVNVSDLPEGRHTVLARVLDGPSAKDTPEREFEIERTAPRVTSVEPASGEAYAPGGLRVTVRFTEPMDPAGFASGSAWLLESRRLTLAASVELSPDGLTGVATLPFDLGLALDARLELRGTDRFGNQLVDATLMRWSAPQSPYDVPADLVADQVASIPITVDPAWSGREGPLAVSYCPFGGQPPPFDPNCREVVVASPAEVATFDTSAYPHLTRLRLAVLAPGVRVSPVRTLVVSHPIMQVTLTPDRRVTNGPVGIQVRATGAIPSSMDVLVDGVVAGRLTGSPGSSQFVGDFFWDAAAPDGPHLLTITAAGWTVQGTGATIVVDRTPPTIRPSVTAYDPRAPAGAALIASEPVTGYVPILVDGLPSARYTYFSLLGSQAPVDGFTEPATASVLLTFDVSGVHDEAGNVALPVSESVAVPLWFPSFGAGPIEVAGTPVVAAEAVTDLLGFLPPDDMDLYTIAPSGEVAWSRSDRRVATLAAAGSTAEHLAIGAGTATGSVEVGRVAAWREGGGTGSGTLQFRTGDPLVPSASLVSTAFTVGAGASPPRPGGEAWPFIAWTEPDGAGGRTLRALDAAGIAIDLPSVPGASPTAAALSHSYAYWANASVLLLAWVDDAATVPQLVLSSALADPFPWTRTTPWSVLLPSANDDPGQPASEPLVAHNTVAWLEGGVVKAGRVDKRSGLFVADPPPSGGGARLLRILRSYPAVPAPFLNPVLVWVEPGPAGDVIAARRWIEGTGWTVLSPVNEGVGGEVRTLAVAGSVVTWTDAAGHVFARRLNR